MILGEVGRSAGARGIEGGALAQLFEKGKEQAAKGMGSYLQNIFAQSGQKAAGMASSAMDMRKMMNQLLTQYMMQKNQISSAEDIAKMNQITQSIMGGIGMVAKGISGGLMGGGGSPAASSPAAGGSYTGAPSLGVNTQAWDPAILKALGL
jgi:hypothetical protein